MTNDTGCATISKKLIDSPSAIGGHPIRFPIIHGKIGPGLASEALWVRSINDSDVVLKLQPKPVKYKTTWVGMHFPMLPAFFIPTKKYYNDYDSLLEINFWIKSNAKTQVFPDSSIVVIDGKDLTAIKSTFWGVPSEPKDSRREESEESKKYVLSYKVWFPIDARKVEKYEFKVRVYNKGLIIFPKIVCQRKWLKIEIYGI